MIKLVCKPLLPVYDKLLVYYLIATLLQAGIEEVLIVIQLGEGKEIYNLLGDRSQLGMKIEYVIQKLAREIADALVVSYDFI